MLTRIILNRVISTVNRFKSRYVLLVSEEVVSYGAWRSSMFNQLMSRLQCGPCCSKLSPDKNCNVIIPLTRYYSDHIIKRLWAISCGK